MGPSLQPRSAPLVDDLECRRRGALLSKHAELATAIDYRLSRDHWRGFTRFLTASRSAGRTTAPSGHCGGAALGGKRWLFAFWAGGLRRFGLTLMDDDLAVPVGPEPGCAQDPCEVGIVRRLAHREIAPLLSDENSSGDGTLIKGEPWCASGSSTMANASMKSLQPKAKQEAAGPGGGRDDPPARPPTSETGSTETKPEIAPMTPPKP